MEDEGPGCGTLIVGHLVELLGRENHGKGYWRFKAKTGTEANVNLANNFSTFRACKLDSGFRDIRCCGSINASDWYIADQRPHQVGKAREV